MRFWIDARNNHPTARILHDGERAVGCPKVALLVNRGAGWQAVRQNYHPSHGRPIAPSAPIDISDCIDNADEIARRLGVL